MTTQTKIGKVSKIRKISKIAIAVGFGVVFCGTAMGPAFAGGHGEERHHEEHHGDHDRHSDHGRVFMSRRPQLLLCASTNYYYAPEPDYYPPAYTTSAATALGGRKPFLWDTPLERFA